ncbi:kinetochore-associated protein KNL-2 homolog [Vicia villosa]|uniref:kinetochore-associated protein KNL-2 homolog n=1 Tax=Vicia villosa TaxID=3911 RepID=UPI00273C024A|nr:kinetochore-associated protein KNL-2 homolog [Vicia villosa]
MVKNLLKQIGFEDEFGLKVDQQSEEELSFSSVTLGLEEFADLVKCFVSDAMKVTLFGWWLVKSPDNRLCISGNASRKGEAVRVFNSSPIVERYDVYSLKNAEGIYIFIRGIINEERTREKGFTPEIFNSFYLGFPPNWETCWVLHCIRDEQVEPGTDSVNAAMDNVSPICQDILFDDEEESISVLSKLPEEAPENNQTPFPGDECQVSKETSGVNVVLKNGFTPFKAIITYNLIAKKAIITNKASYKKTIIT